MLPLLRLGIGTAQFADRAEAVRKAQAVAIRQARLAAFSKMAIVLLNSGKIFVHLMGGQDSQPPSSEERIGDARLTVKEEPGYVKEEEEKEQQEKGSAAPIPLPRDLPLAPLPQVVVKVEESRPSSARF